MMKHHCRKTRVKQEPHRYYMTKDTHTVYTHQVTSETQKDYQNKRTSTDTTADWYMCLSSVPETDPGVTGVLLSMFYAEHPVLLPRGSSGGLHLLSPNRTALAVSEKQQISKTRHSAFII